MRYCGPVAEKQSAIFQVLIVNCLKDETVRGHAIDGLGRFGRIDAISILESLSHKKGLYDYKAVLGR